MAETIVEVRNLKQHFRINSHFTVKAVDGISFSIHKNEIFALVGESGSGKSTVARSLIGAYPPTMEKFIFMEKILPTEQIDVNIQSCCTAICKLYFRTPLPH